MTDTKKLPFLARVRTNRKISERVFRLSLQLDSRGCKDFANITPGQFAEFDLSNIAIPPAHLVPESLRDVSQRNIILRRPFSFCDVQFKNTGEVYLDIVYCVLGAATVRMMTLKKDDQISVLGPLGNGFNIPAGKKHALLVAGGLGAPPMQHLASFMRSEYPDMEVVAFAGAQSYEDLPFTVRIDNERGVFLEEFDRMRVHAHVTTDDGSAGKKGFVTEPLEKWLEENKSKAKDTIIYTCGPEPMLASVSGLAESFGIDCQVSLERIMACGIGLCQSCAVEAKGSDGGDSVYKLCCKNGPVFDSSNIIFTC
jgi:dihydroorotate dehydrogenase electron transfer subunit